MKHAKSLTRRAECPGCHGRGTVEIVDAAKLRAVRVASGVSLRELAKRLGFTAPYLSDIERGRRNCTVPILMEYQIIYDNRKEWHRATRRGCPVSL